MGEEQRGRRSEDPRSVVTNFRNGTRGNRASIRHLPGKARARGAVLSIALLVLASSPVAHASMQGDAPTYARTAVRYHVPDVPLTDARSGDATLGAVLDTRQVIVLNFVFTSCTTICPLMSAVFADAQRRLGADRDRVRLVSISLDPEHDTPARLAEYAARVGADGDWRWLTGTSASAIAVATAFGAWRGDKASHALVTYVRGTPGDQWLRLDGVVSAADLVRECRELLGATEAAEAR